MADLSQLLSIAPTTAAGFMGINQSNNEIDATLKQAEMRQLMEKARQEMQMKADLHPLDLQSKSLANQKTTAEIPGVAAKSELDAIKARAGNSTYDSDVDNANTKNRMQAYNLVGTHLGGVADAIDANPNVPPAAVLAQELQARGIPQPIQQSMMQRYSNVAPQDLSKTLREHGQNMLAENEKYKESYDTTSLTQDAGIIKNAANNRTLKEIAQANIDAGKFNKSPGKPPKTVEDEINGSRKASERYQKLVDAATQAHQAGNDALAESYMARAEAVRPQAEAELANATQPKPGSVNIPGVTQGAVPVNPGADIRPPGSVTAPANPQAAMAEAAKQAWGGYEPEKYDYRVGPNGKLQRKAK